MIRSEGINLHRVDDRKSITRARRTRSTLERFGIMYFLIFVSAGCLLVWQPAQITAMNDRIAVLEKQLQELKIRNEDLKRQVSAMESLTYVEKEARTRLGMVDAGEVRSFAVELPQTPTQTNASASVNPKENVIQAALGRIAKIFGAKEATAKGRQ